MIDKIWNCLAPPDGCQCDIKNQGYIIIYDGNMAFVVPNDTGTAADAKKTFSLLPGDVRARDLMWHELTRGTIAECLFRLKGVIVPQPQGQGSLVRCGHPGSGSPGHNRA
jgi:hypothetical protein